MKQYLQKLLSLTGFELIRSKNKSNHFNNAFIAQKHLIRKINPIIFDVGAHIGSVTLLYKQLYKKSTIFSFEPFNESFNELKKNVENEPNVKIINTGLSNVIGKARFHSNQFAPTNSILTTDKMSDEIWGENVLNTKEVIEIDVTTIDEVVEAHAIEKIDILKLDVQGAENLVLQGAEKTLKTGKIDLIYTEIILLPTYKSQTTFQELLIMMNNYDFSLYNIYNSSFTKHGQLRQIDVIFIHNTLITSN